MTNSQTLLSGLAALMGLTAAAAAQSFNDTLVFDDSPESILDVEFGDLNGDGRLDLVSIAGAKDYILWQPAKGDGTFGPPRPIQFDPWVFQVGTSMDLGDVDGDGDLDVISVHGGMGGSGRLRVHENLGGGNFALPQTIASGAAKHASLADLNGDGVPDIVLFSGNVDVAWYRGLGTGAFAPRATISTAATDIDEVLAADLDGDGDQDVVFMARLAGTIFWSENLGGGTFGPHQTATIEFTNPRDLEIVDVDGDGNLDLLSLSTQGRYVAWVPNNGSGQFGARRTVGATASGAPTRNAAGDLDGDGDIDIVSSWGLGSGTLWYENLGAGTFALPSPLAPGVIDPSVLKVVDLDGDSDLDLFVATQNLSWAPNQGAGTFGPLRATSRFSISGFLKPPSAGRRQRW